MGKTLKFVLILSILEIIAFKQISSTPRHKRNENEKNEGMNRDPIDRNHNMEKGHTMSAASPNHGPSPYEKNHGEKNNGMSTMSMSRAPYDKNYFKKKFHGMSTEPSEKNHHKAKTNGMSTGAEEDKNHDIEKPIGRSIVPNDKPRENKEKIDDHHHKDEPRGHSVGGKCACQKIYKPVCASNGNTYANECLFGCERDMNPSIQIVMKGKCGGNHDGPEGRAISELSCMCTKEHSPVCGESGGRRTTFNNYCIFMCAQKSDPNLTLYNSEPCWNNRRLG